jgi:hypothetical protein
MSGEGCTLQEHVIGGMRAVTIENRFLSVTVLPEKGADVYSLVYKPRATDVLWKSPWGLRKPRSAVFDAATSETAWLEQYEGGWQELFPNAGDACTYGGATLNFHGEASVSAWDYTVRCRSAASVVVEFTTTLARSPFRMRRTIAAGRLLPALIIEERIENCGEQDLHFMWGHHPAFGAPFLDGGCRLQVPARTFLAHDVDVAPVCRIPAGSRGSWPVLDGKDGRKVDLSVVPPSSERIAEFGYICDLDDGWYGLTNGSLGFGFGLAWPKEVFPYVWFWQELRGSIEHPWSGDCYVMAVEPFTSMPGVGLAKAVESGTAPVLTAGSSIDARLAATFFEPGDVESISVDGIARVRRT